MEGIIVRLTVRTPTNEAMLTSYKLLSSYYSNCILNITLYQNEPKITLASEYIIVDVARLIEIRLDGVLT